MNIEYLYGNDLDGMPLNFVILHNKALLQMQNLLDLNWIYPLEFFQNSGINNPCMAMFKVLLIGGSTGTMLEALQVVGDSNRYRQLYEVTSFAVCNNNKTLWSFRVIQCIVTLMPIGTKKDIYRHCIPCIMTPLLVVLYRNALYLSSA